MGTCDQLYDLLLGPVMLHGICNGMPNIVRVTHLVYMLFSRVWFHYHIQLARFFAYTIPDKNIGNFTPNLAFINLG